MATSNSNRDVRLGISVETTGDENVRRLAGDIRDVGTAGEAAAPEVARLTTELTEQAAATKALRQAQAASSAEVIDQKQALAANGDELKRLRANTDAAAKSAQEYRDAEKTLKNALIDGGAALRTKKADLEAAKAATRESVVAEIALRNELNTVAAAHRQAGSAAATSAAQQAQAATTVREGLSGIASQLRTLQQVAAAAVGGQLLGGLIGDVGRTADAYSNLSARIKLVTGDGAAFNDAFKGVSEIAQRTNTSLESTGELFGRIAAAGKSIGVSNADALRLTETINQSLIVSGASAESSSAAITQLLQGLQSGVLRGDEFNSVMEQAPRLAKALSDGLGVTTGELRKLAETGQLTSATVIRSLQGQSAALQAEFQQIPLTIGRSIQTLSNAWTAYIGEASKATGASATAAHAIEAVATHLDGLATLLYSAGKAAVAYQAVKLAATFLEIGTAARTSTVAVAAQTTAVEANTVATRANAVAGAEAAAGAGRFASALSTVKVFALVTVLTNLREIGTAIGEGTAKLFGYGKAFEELERRQRADEEATRANAAAKAELAQKTQLAADKALGLTDQSRKLIGEFNDLVGKGGEVSEALGKLAKDLRLGDLTGIRNAVTALDALAQQGKLTGAQVREALGSALNGQDLNVFRINALAAFDGTEQGARRLKLALDAIADESLKRAGTSLQELNTGFSETATKALTDLDNLAQSLKDLKLTGDDAGRALAGSLDKALSAANTERAVKAVIDRLEALGKQGLLTGEQLAAGLEKARAKIDDLKPGINSLSEALKTFGLQTREQLQSVADKLKTSYDQISNSTQVALADKVKAFNQYRDAAIAANGGVESSEIKVQAEMLRIKGAAVDAAGGIVDSMRVSGQSVDALGGKVQQLAGSLSGVRQQVADLSILGGNKYDPQGNALDDKGNPLVIQGQVNVPAGAVFDTAAFNRAQRASALSGLAAPNPADYYVVGSNLAGPITGPTTNGTANGGAGYSGFGSLRARQIAAEQAAARAAPKVPGSTTHTVNIVLGGRSTSIETASAGDASALVALLKQLEDAATRATIGP